MDPEAIQIDGDEDFNEALGDLLVAADTAGVSQDTMAGLLTAYLARLRGDIRLPLGMEPERARHFRERAEEHLRETMEVEVVITPDVLEEIDLQLSAFESDEQIDDQTVEGTGETENG